MPVMLYIVIPRRHKQNWNWVCKKKKTRRNAWFSLISESGDGLGEAVCVPPRSTIHLSEKKYRKNAICRK